MTTVVYLDDIPTPYRLGVHQRIQQQADFEYHVLFCAKSEPGRSWQLDYGKLNHSFLDSWQFRPPGQVNPISLKLSKRLGKTLESLAPDVMVLSGYASPTMLMAARWCRKRRIPYGMACETSHQSQVSRGFSKHIKDCI